MKRFLLTAVGILLAVGLWVVLVFLGFSEGWGRQPVVASSSPDAFMQAAERMITEDHVGNAALVLIEDGEIAGTNFTSAGEPVGPHTRFQVASLSKWLAAWGVMTLVRDGEIDLDAPVSTYLTRWQLPDGPFEEDEVTVRRLLSHTAGLGDGLGYQGFAQAEEVQSLEDSLTQAGDASPNADGAVSVVAEPGSGWNYSGGGYTLLQLVVEEVSGESFSDYMASHVFRPLGMTDTTFAYDEAAAADLAENYNLDGEAEPFRHYTALAATSLFTSAADMARFAMAQAPGAEDRYPQTLSPDLRAEMRAPHGSQMGADIWGLGTMLYAANGEGDFIIGHDGNNEPAINTAVRLNPDTGDGIVVLETGSNLLATEIAGEWVFWKTGNVDFLMFSMRMETMLLWMAIGALLILIVGIVIGWKWRRSR